MKSRCSGWALSLNLEPSVVYLSICVSQNDRDCIGMESGTVTWSNRSKMAVTGVGSQKMEGKW